MIVIPIVVSSLIVGVAGAGDMKQVGKLGLKALIYFEIVTTIAIVVGLLAGNLFHPGTGVDMGSLAKTSISSYVETTKETQHNGIVDTILSIVPTNLFESLSQGNMLPIIFFSVMFGIGVAAIGEKGKPVLRFFQGVSEAMFYVTNLVMKVAPIGVFGLIGVTVTQFGLKSLIPLSKLVFTVYGTIIFFVVVVLGLIAWLFRVNIFNLFKILKDELILAYSTASSEAVLPRLMEKMEKFGCPKSITTLVIPTGYSFNLDGSTLYQSLAALFIAQMYGIHMSIGAQISLVLVLMVTSKGIAGVPGVSFVVLWRRWGRSGFRLKA